MPNFKEFIKGFEEKPISDPKPQEMPKQEEPKPEQPKKDYSAYKQYVTKTDKGVFYENPLTKYVSVFPTEDAAYDYADKNEQMARKTGASDAEQIIKDFREGKIDRKKLASNLRSAYNREYILEYIFNKLKGE